MSLEPESSRTTKIQRNEISNPSSSGSWLIRGIYDLSTGRHGGHF